MHGIQKPIDKVLSTESSEWHGLADVHPTIGDAEVAPLLFPIVSGKVVLDVGNGVNVSMNNHKGLAADFRTVRPDLIDDDSTSQGFVPLHIPKNSYRPIENGELWETMKAALRNVKAKVTSVGTLEGAKKFFISTNLDGQNEFTVNGDNYLAHLNFVTSHDGTLGVKAYDSTVRIVCMNTLRASLSAQGEVGFNVFHTQGADVAMKNLPELIDAVLTGRAQFRTDLEYLASQSVSQEFARQIALGYFAMVGDSDEVATRSRNAADEIALLFHRGAGNKGQTLYDLLNGATEFWTGGNGTGKKATAAEKVYKANFGAAADHKNAFFNLLMNPTSVLDLRERGERAETEFRLKEARGTIIVP